MSLSDKERADVAVACLKMFVETGSKVGLGGVEIFDQAHVAYTFVMKLLNEPDTEQPKVGSAKR